ncbi:Crp/Fnr family transcriptional regulator [Mucilaginibacter auburnensis]|uniref:CRP/FNR family transcriptional regulator n=1 Tax=Mucilaginibacter auburnensis TaxID=1457233 RepID=A0A2H9VP39_9SPHI|nr:Crp/Fnr family transcriptional regulator [Mucilaginibacter auburnensis]PJJ80081.1 CRP/FNR family transcriptional regulator [Mucilaginibacter auburnensis]
MESTTQPVSELINDLFPQFEPALRHFLIENAGIRHIKADEQVMKTGQYMKATVLIAQGRIKLYREGREGEEFFMYYLEPGNACALSMVCATKQQTSQISAKAVDDAVLITIPVELMDDMMKLYKTWYYFVLETYRSRFEELLTVIDDVAFRSMDERLLVYLRKHSRQTNNREIRLSHSEIATDLNSSREVISRLLKKMEQRGLVTLNRNYIEWLEKITYLNK